MFVPRRISGSADQLADSAMFVGSASPYQQNFRGCLSDQRISGSADQQDQRISGSADQQNQRISGSATFWEDVPDQRISGSAGSADQQEADFDYNRERLES